MAKVTKEQIIQKMLKAAQDNQPDKKGWLDIEQDKKKKVNQIKISPKSVPNLLPKFW